MATPMEQDPFAVIDLHPVAGRLLRDVIHEELMRAKRHRQVPFLELGGESCGVCHALRQRLDVRPRTIQVRQTFAGTRIIRIAIDEWPGALETLGLTPEQRIPIYAAIDTTGRITRLLSVDSWTLRNVDTDTQNTMHRFFTESRRIIRLQ